LALALKSDSNGGFGVAGPNGLLLKSVRAALEN